MPRRPGHVGADVGMRVRFSREPDRLLGFLLDQPLGNQPESGFCDRSTASRASRDSGAPEARIMALIAITQTFEITDLVELVAQADAGDRRTGCILRLRDARLPVLVLRAHHHAIGYRTSAPDRPRGNAARRTPPSDETVLPAPPCGPVLSYTPQGQFHVYQNGAGPFSVLTSLTRQWQPTTVRIRTRTDLYKFAETVFPQFCAMNVYFVIDDINPTLSTID